MNNYFIFIDYNGVPKCVEVPNNKETTNSLNGYEIKQLISTISGIPLSQHHIVHSCRNLNDNQQFPTDSLSNLSPFHLILNLNGGKGGFGSLLRGGPAGVVAKKTTNFNACRDLNGRRIRHVNQEKKMAEAATKTKEKKKEDAPKKKQKSNFNEEEFNEQLVVLTSSVSNAMEEGMKNFDFKLGKRKNVQHDIRTVKLSKFDDLDFEDDEEEIEEQKQETTQQKDQPKEENDQVNNGAKEEIQIEETSQITIEEEITNEEKEKKKEEKKEEGFDLNNYNDAKELEALGMEVLKVELQNRGLLCGGSLQQRAERLFSIKNLAKEKWPLSVFPSAKKNKNKKKKNKKPNQQNKPSN